ncbi:serine hydrolase [Streptomyces sp. SBT349]|uniref:serine hydrolase n=1 Tax=Streptomyces sp. SBT349 TaxID=1580539 RepID=UPI00066C9CCD|nr:serine hydrolase [Streptomyces sp. SBT349]
MRAPQWQELGEILAEAVSNQHLMQLVDFGGLDEPPPPPVHAVPLTAMPYIDLAVIELGEDSTPLAAGNVLFSPRYPDGIVVPVGRDLAATSVRWLRWDTESWGQGRTGDRELTRAPLTYRAEFMSPYTGCVHKLMIAFQVLRLADEGILDLDAEYAYLPECNDGPERSARPGTATLTAWLDRLITVSDNQAGCALIKLLHDLDRVGELNGLLADLGLSTLQLGGTNPRSGGRWRPGLITMTALDSARLLLLISGAPGVLWETPAGGEVRSSLLSPRSRKLLMDLMAEQGYNDMLSSANWIGSEDRLPGIPHSPPERWVDRRSGHIAFASEDFGYDVRAHLGEGEVAFAHKTGNTHTVSADVGIVSSLPGHPFRHYIVAIFTTLGSRFADPRLAAGTTAPDEVYTERIAGIGRAIDVALTRRARARGGPVHQGTGADGGRAR